MLQPIERTVIELRYGIYDKLQFEYLPYALRYRIYEIMNFDEYKNIAVFFPDYENFLLQRKHLILKGVKRYFLSSSQRMIKRKIKHIFS